jgi:hypothetical protein
MLPPFFRRLPRGLELVMAGMAVWLIGNAPLMAYLLIVRLRGEEGNGGGGFTGAFGFALNVVGTALALGGLITWFKDGRKRIDGGAAVSDRRRG